RQLPRPAAIVRRSKPGRGPLAECRAALVDRLDLHVAVRWGAAAFRLPDKPAALPAVHLGVDAIAAWRDGDARQRPSQLSRDDDPSAGGGVVAAAVPRHGADWLLSVRAAHRRRDVRLR